MISIYSDGSSGAGGGKPGGYGWIIVKDVGSPEPAELDWGYGGSPSTTNNLMELEGAIRGLEKAMELRLHECGDRLELVSDSQYVLNMATGSWTVNFNHQQVEQLQALYKASGCSRTRWVRGHEGEPFNEGCDELAKRGKIENTPPELLAKKTRRKAK